MPTRIDLIDWVQEALRAHGGRATVVEVCEYVWGKYESILRDSGKLFYTWQYDVRWAATALRRRGIMRAAAESQDRTWELVDSSSPNGQP